VYFSKVTLSPVLILSGFIPTYFRGSKMKLDEEQFTSSLTDQQYLVHRARLERDRDPCAAKVVYSLIRRDTSMCLSFGFSPFIPHFFTVNVKM
jgi:hypothetical protein